MRPPLPLAVLFLICAPSARAQTKTGAVEVSLTPGMPGPSAPLTPNGVPQLVTLNLAAPSLALTPGVVAAPSAAAAKPAAPLAPTAAVPLAGAAPVPVLPASAIAPEAAVGRPVALDRAGKPEDVPFDAEHASLSEMLEKTRRLFGEARGGPAGLSIDETRPSVILPVPGAESLPETLVVGGETFTRKKELHATIVGTRDAHPYAALKKAAEGPVPTVALRDEYRVVRKDGKASLIQMADVRGLDAYYARLEDALGRPKGSIPRPPGHVTLYTAGDDKGRGIGIYTDEELAKYSVPIPAPFAGGENRLFGESGRPGFKSAEYFRPGQPFEFGAKEVEGYKAALDAAYAKSTPEGLKRIVDSAEALARSAGIEAAAGMGANLKGEAVPMLTVLPKKDGHRLNRLAWDLKKSFGTTVVYAPDRTKGGVAAFNSMDNILFLPDFGKDGAYEAILHESRHASFAARLRRGEIGLFHPVLRTYGERPIAPGAWSYTEHLSIEEISTHAKTVLHDLIRALRSGDADAVSSARADALQFADVLRSVEINMFHLQRMTGVKSYVVTGPGWQEIPGGHWEAINLPHSILVVPVLDAPAPKKRNWLQRAFADEPDSPAAAAAKLHAAALRGLISTLVPELNKVLEALNEDVPDVKAARKAAAKMAALADKADRDFAKGR